MYVDCREPSGEKRRCTQIISSIFITRKMINENVKENRNVKKMKIQHSLQFKRNEKSVEGYWSKLARRNDNRYILFGVKTRA